MGLSADDIRRALAAITRRHADQDALLACPRCGAEGLVLIDRSARPHAEWYHFSCAGCGLDEPIHIPLSPPATGGLD